MPQSWMLRRAPGPKLLWIKVWASPPEGTGLKRKMKCRLESSTQRYQLSGKCKPLHPRAEAEIFRVTIDRAPVILWFSFWSCFWRLLLVMFSHIR